MIEETTTGSNLSRKATLLMAEVLQMANRVLPLSVAAKIQAGRFVPSKNLSNYDSQTIPRIFDMATNYSDGEHRIVGTSALSAIDSFNRNRARLQPCTIKSNRQR
jgi:large subunit ribosomal protein L17e